EFLFVNDGSTDATLQTLRQMAGQDERVKYLSLSRNFGKEGALYAGLSHATGDYVAVMDADGQDPPAMLGQMYALLQQGQYDCVATRRVNRAGEPPIRSFFARMFYRIINRISKTEIVDGARDFRMMSRQMVQSVLEMREVNRFSKGIFSWVGYNTTWLEYVNTQRLAGETKWSFWRLFLYSIDGIVAFSTAPLGISSVAGVLCCILAVALAIFYAVKSFFVNDPAGFPTLICIILLVGGLQLFSIGVLGQYLAKTYLEAKQRPIYIVKESNLGPKQP
ncbi:glycosyltransferase family 2 protein, partial [Ruminococcaceae bacterium OttesenSCG-928-O06]|nr:glycosyltransferase family 2 protein [Ruminococcaceae bacterium OttesenSCG-928-O06]